jgi:hypothetical protein
LSASSDLTPASSPGGLSSAAAGGFGAPRFGRVVAYDFDRGLGMLEELPVSRAEMGRYRFHCTAIADGSRTIEAGTAVGFVLAPALGGVLEARSVTTLPALP